MLQGDYIKVIVFGLGQYPEFLSDYFYRQHLKAKENHISGLEFFTGLNKAYVFLLDELNNIYNNQLNTYYHYLNTDEVLPIEKRMHYPKPALESISLALFTYLKGVFDGVPKHICLSDLTAVNEALQTALTLVSNETEKIIEKPTDLPIVPDLPLENDNVKMVKFTITDIKISITNQPHTPETLKAHHDYLEKQANDMFNGLLREFEKEKNAANFYTSELDLVQTQIILISEYIDGVNERMVEAARRNNGLTKGLKRPTEVMYLPGYKNFLRWLQNRKVELESEQEARQKDFPKSQVQANEFVTKYLSEFQNQFNSEKDYLKVLNAVNQFFSTDKIDIEKPVFVRSGNIKKIAFAMGQIWRSQINEVITYEYLTLYKKLFSIYANSEIDKDNIKGSNLYKYSLSLS